MRDTSVAILGAGNMGEAIIRALIGKGIDPQCINVYDRKRERLSEVVKIYNVKSSPDNRSAVVNSRFIIIAVKPQDINEVLSDIKDSVNGKIVISIAAGIKLKKISSLLGKKAKVVRAMPNICAITSDSATGLFFSEGFSEKEKEEVKELMEMFGRVAILNEEGLLDVVTGLSGSGPAFVFVFMEALTDAGVKLGLPRKDARILAIQTVLGSAKLAMDYGKHFAELRDMVTSPGGTTMAGLKILEEKRFRAAIMDAVEAATKRAKELER